MTDLRDTVASYLDRLDDFRREDVTLEERAELQAQLTLAEADLRAALGPTTHDREIRTSDNVTVAEKR